jgi:hypothetical protein
MDLLELEGFQVGDAGDDAAAAGAEVDGEEDGNGLGKMADGRWKMLDCRALTLALGTSSLGT